MVGFRLGGMPGDSEVKKRQTCVPQDAYHQVCWSVTQAVLALSAGEAELYALVKAASQGLGLRAMLADLGIGMK